MGQVLGTGAKSPADCPDTIPTGTRSAKGVVEVTLPARANQCGPGTGGQAGDAITAAQLVVQPRHLPRTGVATHRPNVTGQ